MQLFSTQKRAAAWIVIALVAALALWLLGPVITPFAVASVLAYALTPLVDRLDALCRGRVPRLLAVIVVELLFILAVSGIVLMTVPILAKEIPLMREQLPELVDKLDSVLAPWLAQFGIHVSLDVSSLKALVLKYLNANYEEAFYSLLASLKLGGSVAFVSKVLELVPPNARPRVDSFTHEADQVLGQYLRGQLLVMVIMAVFYSTGLALFGLDLALPIGFFTGLAMFIPYLGFGVGLILAILAGALQFASVKALVMVAVVYGAGQAIEGFYVTPRFVGERIGLHPLAVIFALLAFAQLFGFVGVLVALPASAVLLVAMRRLRASYMASKLYQS